MYRNAYQLMMLFLFILLAQCLFARETIDFNKGWKFKKGEDPTAYLKIFDDSQWQNVKIPHDWAIAGPFDPNGVPETGKLPWKGQGWYRKNFNVDSNLKGKIIYLLFDGIMASPEIYINGKSAGGWDYGYNSFYLDITKFLEYGKENVISIHVDTRNFDSRWYPGAGIYRKISMIITDPIHVNIWGTHVFTSKLSNESAAVNYNTEVVNNSPEEKVVSVISTIINSGKKIIISDTLQKKLNANSQVLFKQNSTLQNPQRWDILSPNLYTLQTVIEENGNAVDTVYTTFGIREIKFTASNGFYLNGRKVMLKGVNLHHDHGPLGSAFNKSAMERQLQKMKDMGCNAIRNSHNIAAPELPELCDEMGLLLFDEAFDKWDLHAGITPETDFYEFMERNFKNFLKRDRNHPSIFIWSIGNEMRDIQANEPGSDKKLKFVTDIVRTYDATRPVTMVNDNMGSVKYGHSKYIDVHSWNYGRRYLPAREADTTKPVIISESASTISTRGYYIPDLPKEKTDFYTEDFQISSYDMNAPDWAEPAEYDFYWQDIDKYVVGEFVWTGFDYIGEPTPYNYFMISKGEITEKEASRSSYFGIVDLCGIAKDRYYLYRSHWLPDSTTVHILPHWNWQDSEWTNIPVFVYTNGDSAELFLNGKSLGKRSKKPDSENLFERYRLMWMDVKYEPGVLKTIAYKNGQVIGVDSVVTASAPVNIKLTPEKSTIKSDGEDLCYILVEVVDKGGNCCPLADNLISFSIEGPGEIAGVGNGNPQSLHSFNSDDIRLFNGKAMLIVRGEESSGEIEIKAMSKGLEGAKIGIKVK